MNAPLVYMLEMLACSGVFLLLYRLIFAQKMSFRFSRIYIIISTLLSAVIPLLNIPVYSAEVVQITIPLVSVGEAVAVGVVPSDSSLDFNTIIFIIYSLCLVLALGVFFSELVRIKGFRRGACHTIEEDYNIYQSTRIKASFSFLRSIYLPEDIDTHERKEIVLHERSHITHRHSIEKIIMSILRAVMWFNPFVWIAYRNLVEVHEYEADRDLLDAGYDITKYRQLILKQLLGYTPEITSGLNNSFTKKRFIMMTKKRTSKYVLLKSLAIIPVMGAMLLLFGFTSKSALNHELDVQQFHAEVTEVETTQPVIEAQNDDEPFVKVETMPKFMGGDMNAFRTWLAENIEFPTIAKEVKEGTVTAKYVVVQSPVTIEFVIEKDGSLSNIKVDAPDELLSKEVERVFMMSPKWTPGKQDGKNVRVKYVLPVVFKLEEESKPETKEEKFFREAETIQSVVETVRSVVEAQNDEEPFIKVETMPKFMRGDLNAFRNWVMENFKYPAEAVKADAQGTIVVEFVIEKDGSLSSIKFLRTPHESFSKETERVLMMSPKWTPGKQDGKDVRVKYVLPIACKLEGESKPETKEEKFFREAETIQSVVETQNDEETFIIVETMPKFMGGDLNSFRDWLGKNIEYSEELAKTGVKGQVVAEFVIEKDGSLADIKFLRSPHELLSKEVERVLLSSPKWTPGKQRGKDVRVKFVIPLHFNLSVDK